MVAAFDYCLHGKGGAAPSIDTAMHGLVDAAHVDHLHPDSGIAIATAADGEELTSEIFGDKVVWVPWRRPGFQLGLDIAAIKAANPQAIGCILGGHGITAWGATQRGVRGQLAVDHRHRRRRTSPSNGKAGAVRSRPLDGYAAAARGRAPGQGRRPGPDPARPSPRHDKPHGRPLHRRRRRARLPGLREHPRLAELGTSCPDHFLRTKVKPMVLDLPAYADGRGVDRPADRTARSPTAPTTRPTTSATPHPTHPAIRGADPLIILIPGVGMFSYGANKQTARVAGEFYVNAINVMRGAEGSRSYAPIDESGEVPHRVLGTGRGQAAADAEAQAAGRPDRAGHRRGSGIGKAIADPARRRGRVRGDRRS